MAQPWEMDWGGAAPAAATGAPWERDWNSEPSAAAGVAKAAASGAAKGAIGLVGLPGDVPRLVDAGVRAAGARLGAPVQEDTRPKTKLQEFRESIGFPSSETIRHGVEAVTGPFYEPQNRLERNVSKVAEFGSGALGGPGSLARRFLSRSVAPGVAAEEAHHAAQGTGYETAAEIGGAVLGGIGGHVALRPGGARDYLRGQLPDFVDQAAITRAEGLIRDAQAQGVNLTWPEALSQVTGRPVLSDTQRIVESAPQSRQQMQDFFSERPGQIDTAARGHLDRIAPSSANPSQIGPTVGATAETAVNDVRQTINDASQPFYDYASTVRLTPSEMARARSIPGFDEASAAVRGDPQLNRYVSHLPDDSVGFLNEVKKYLDTAAENAAAPVNQARNMQRAAGYGRDAAEAKNIATGASGDYQIALDVQQQARERFLDPLLKGPLGQMADKDITTQRAINALFPKEPLAGSADEVSTAVSALAKRNPSAARELVRAHLEAELHKAFNAAGRGQEAAQFAGARFAHNVAGSPAVVTQNLENLQAAITALPHGRGLWEGFQRFLQIAQATGTRQGKGSLTSFNTRELERISTGGGGETLAKHGLSPGEWLHFVHDAVGKWQQGRNLDQLARIITNPESANLLRGIQRMPPNSAQTVTLVGRLISSATAERRQKASAEPAK